MTVVDFALNTPLQSAKWFAAKTCKYLIIFQKLQICQSQEYQGLSCSLLRGLNQILKNIERYWSLLKQYWTSKLQICQSQEDQGRSFSLLRGLLASSSQSWQTQEPSIHFPFYKQQTVRNLLKYILYCEICDLWSRWAFLLRVMIPTVE